MNKKYILVFVFIFAIVGSFVFRSVIVKAADAAPVTIKITNFTSDTVTLKDAQGKIVKILKSGDKGFNLKNGTLNLTFDATSEAQDLVAEFAGARGLNKLPIHLPAASNLLSVEREKIAAILPTLIPAIKSDIVVGSKVDENIALLAGKLSKLNGASSILSGIVSGKVLNDADINAIISASKIAGAPIEAKKAGGFLGLSFLGGKNKIASSDLLKLTDKLNAGNQNMPDGLANIQKLSKNITFKKDSSLDAIASRVNPGDATKQSSFDMPINVEAPYAWVYPNASQTLIATATNLVATHNMVVVGNSYKDTYIPAWNFYGYFVGNNKDNPINSNLASGYYSYPTNVGYSSNVTAVDIYVGSTPWRPTMFKIPAGQFAVFNVQNSIPKNMLYPDTYYSEMFGFGFMPFWNNVYLDANGYPTMSNYSYSSYPYYDFKPIPSTKTNAVTVAGEASPYLLKWNREAINSGSQIVVEGIRLGSQVNVKVNAFNGSSNQEYNFTKTVASIGGGKGRFSFVPVPEGITITAPYGLGVSVSSVSNPSLGQSNYINFRTQ